MENPILTPEMFAAIRANFVDEKYRTITLEAFCSLSKEIASEAIATFRDVENPSNSDLEKRQLTATWFHFQVPKDSKADSIALLHKFVPSVAIAASLAVDSLLNTSFGNGNEGACSAYGELPARAIVFAGLCLLSWPAANWIEFPDNRIKDIFLNSVLFASIPVWLLTTSDNYLICFISHGHELGRGNLKITRLAVGLVLAAWALVLGQMSMALENGLKRGSFNLSTWCAS